MTSRGMDTSRHLAVIVAVSLVLSLSGCIWYSRWQESKQSAAYTEQRTRLLAMYNDCLARYASEPQRQRVDCEVYTQSLLALDVRGLR
jgi:hypothetical protein